MFDPQAVINGLVVGLLDCGPTGWRLESLVPDHCPPPQVHDWVHNGLGMSSRVCATGHIQDPMPLIEKVLVVELV